MQRSGRRLTMGVTAPLAAAGGAAVKTAADFESGMKRVQALSGATGASFDAMREKALEVGRETAFSAKEAAGGLAFLSKAGFDAEESISALEGVTDLAAAGQMDLARAGDVASNVLKGYGMQAEEISRVNDVLAETATSTNSSIEGLGQAFSMAGPVAKSAGLSFEETAGLLGKMGDAGIQAGRAGRTLRAAIGRLLDPSKKTQAALDRLGVSVTDSQGNMRSLTEIVGDLASAGASTGDVMKIFGRRAGPGMQVLLKEGQGALEDYTEQLENSAGAASEMADKQLEGLSGRLKVLKSSLEGLAIAIAETGLLDMVTSLVERVTTLVNKVASANPDLLRWGVILAGVAAAAGPLLIVLGGMVSAAGTLLGVASSIGPAFLGIAGAVAGLGKVAKDNLGAIKERLLSIVGGAGSLTEAIQRIPAELSKAFGSIRGRRKLFRALTQGLKGVTQAIQDLPWSQVGAKIAGVLNQAFYAAARTVRDLPWGNLLDPAKAALVGAGEALVSFLSSVDWGAVGAGIQRLASHFVNRLLFELNNVNFNAALSSVGEALRTVGRTFRVVLGGAARFLWETVTRIPWKEIGVAFASAIARGAIALKNRLARIPWKEYAADARKRIGNALVTVVSELDEHLVQKVNWGAAAKKAAGMFNHAVVKLREFLTGFNWVAMGETAGEMFNEAVRLLKDMLSRVNWVGFGNLVARMFGDAVKRLIGFVRGVNWTALGTAASDMMKRLVQILTSFIQAVNWPKVARRISDFASTIVDSLVGFITSVDWAGVANRISTFVSTLVDKLVAFIKAVDWAGVADDIRDLMVTLVEKLVSLIKGVDWAEVGRSLGAFVRAIVDGLVDLMLKMEWRDLWDFGVAVAEAIWEALKGFLKGIGGFLEGALGIDIPHLAEGGIVRQPTLSLIGEAGPEAVIPLDRYRALQDAARAPTQVPGGRRRAERRTDPRVLALLEQMLRALEEGGDVFLGDELVGEISRAQSQGYRRRGGRT